MPTRRIWDYNHDVFRRSLSKGSKPVIARVLEKTTENSERLSQQERPRIECGISRLSLFSADLLDHWWGVLSFKGKNYPMHTIFVEIITFNKCIIAEKSMKPYVGLEKKIMIVFPSVP